MRPRPHFKTCRRCWAVGVVYVTAVKRAAPRDQEVKTAHIVDRKFESMGWEVGRKAICPACNTRRETWVQRHSEQRPRA